MLCFGLWTTLSAQAVLGGLTPKHWLISDYSANEQAVVFKDALAVDGANIVSSCKEKWFLNFNATLCLQGFETIPQLSLKDLDLSKMTIFVVYQSRMTNEENVVWSIEQDGRTSLMLTTDRLANLLDYEYINFTEQRSLLPKLNAYFHNEKMPSHTNSTLLIGAQSERPKTPATKLKGAVAELIIYDRVLMALERQKVESYLALKYGLTLTHPYYDALGVQVWNSKKYKHHIAGIGRDTSSSLNQKQSSSSEEQNLLTIGAGSIAESNAANTAEIPNHHHLVWGNDNAPLEWGSSFSIELPLLQRQWRMQRTREQLLSTEVHFDTKQIVDKLDKRQTLWLVIDETGTGNYTPGAISYYKAAPITQKGIAVFKDVIWDADSSGSDVFSFTMGDDLLTSFSIDAPNCSNEDATGSIRLEAIGGVEPYKCSLKSDKEEHPITAYFNEEEVLELKDLSVGLYDLVIEDANGIKTQHRLKIQANDAPVSPLKDQYVIPSNGYLFLDAEIDDERMEYLWIKEGQILTNQATLEIEDAGVYELELSKDGCTSHQWIRVEDFHRKNVVQAQLYPNPSSDGQFTLTIDLQREEDLELMITNEAGGVIATQSLKGKDFYRYNGMVGHSGIYAVYVGGYYTEVLLKLVVD